MLPMHNNIGCNRNLYRKRVDAEQRTPYCLYVVSTKYLFELVMTHEKFGT